MKRFKSELTVKYQTHLACREEKTLMFLENILWEIYYDYDE